MGVLACAARAQVIPTAAARRRSAAPAPTAMTRPREEADEDSEAAASAVAPEAGSVSGRGCDGEGIDRCGQIDEGPDRSFVQGEKCLFDIAFEEGIIRGGDRRTLF